MIPLGVLASSKRNGGGPLAATYVTTASSASGLTTYTFTGVSIGTASADRRIVIAAAARAASNLTLSSVTVDGVSATVDYAPTTANGSATGFASIAAPTGTTATITVTWSGAAARSAIGIVAVTGGALSVSSTAASNGSSATVTGVAGGFVLAQAYRQNIGTWSGVTGAWTTTITAGHQHRGAMSTATGSVTATESNTGLQHTSAIAYAPA